MKRISIELRRSILAMILSGVAIVGLVYFLKSIMNYDLQEMNFANNIIFLLLFILIAPEWKTIIDDLMVREGIFSFIIGQIYSGCLVCGMQLDYLGGIIWNYKTLLKVLFLGVFLQFLILYLMRVLPYNRDGKGNTKESSIRILTFGVIFFSWFIEYLILFPGVYGYDAPNQIDQILGKVPLSSYQPLLHTFFLGECVKMGMKLVGSYELGMAVYSFVQMTFMAWVASKVCVYISKKSKSNVYLICTVLFFIVFPLHSVLVVSTTKDIFFTGFYVLIFLDLLRAIEEPEKLFGSYWNIFCYCFKIIMLCALRSNGIYILIFVIPFAILFLKKIKKQLFCYTVLAVVIFLLTQNCVINVLGIEKGDSLREMLSIPSQQMARAYNMNINEFQEEEIEILYEIIPKECLEIYSYRSLISDNIKGGLNTKQLKNEPMKYIKLYLQIGLKCPKSYIEGALMNCLPMFYPNKYYQDERQYHPYIEIDMIDAKLYNDQYLELERNSFFPKLEEKVSWFWNNAVWMKIPIISSMFTIGTYFFLSIFFLFLILYKKKYELFVPISFIMGLWITIFLGPVSLVRYAYPIIFCTPIIIICILQIANEERR